MSALDCKSRARVNMQRTDRRPGWPRGKSKPGARGPQSIALRLLHNESNPAPLSGEKLPLLDVGPFLTCGNCGRLLVGPRRCCELTLAPGLYQIELSKKILNAARLEACGAALAGDDEEGD